MERQRRWYDYFTINMYWFALTARSQTLAPLIIPLFVQQFVMEGTKGTYVGIIRLWALMVAVLAQALFGIISDRSTSRWGRRRPFIFGGAIGEVVIILLIGFVAGLEGMTGFWVLFTLYILSMIASNGAHAATQGLIPDLVPEEKRGVFSGVKTFLELPLPLIFVSFVIGKMASTGNYWGALITLVILILVSMTITMFAPEKPLTGKLPPMNWKPFMRQVVMTAMFTLIIIGVGMLVKLAIRVAEGVEGLSAYAIVAGAGLIGMSIAIGLGVWVSIQISLGAEGIRENTSFTWWVVTRLAFLAGAVNLAGFMVYFLQERFEEYAGEAAAGPAAKIVMFVGVFILVTALPGGWLADRIGKKRLIVAACVLAAAGTLVVILSPGMALIYIGGSLIGAGLGLFYPAIWALGTEIVPQDKAGQFLGLSNLAGAGAGAVGAYIGGPIADSMSYTLLISIYGVLFLLAIITLMGIKDQQVR
jgi:MFS family permease